MRGRIQRHPRAGVLPNFGVPACRVPARDASLCPMSTLVEIESAADALSVPEKQELLLFLATRLQAGGQTLPPPRRFTREQVTAWVAADEEEWQRVQAAR